MRTKAVRIATSLVVASMLLVSCGAPSQGTPAAGETSIAPAATEGGAMATQMETPQEPQPAKGTLVIGKGAIPTTGDPAYDTGAWALAVYSQVFDTLVVFNNGKIQPSVATSWKAVDDLTWEFKLRDDVYFQNGEPLDAEAVKFTLDRILNPDEAIAWRGSLSTIDNVEVIDKTTVRLHTSAPFGPLVQRLLVAFIIPPKYYQEVGKEAFAEKPIGSGPFKWVDFDPVSFLDVEVWPDSWRWQGMEPGLAGVTWKKLPEESTRVAALEAGEIDVAEQVPGEVVDTLKGEGINVVNQLIAQTIVVNLRSTWDTPLADKRVRQAINYAVDKETVIDTILLGNATISDSQLVGPDAFGYNPNLKPYPYDPDKAKELLAEAGYPDGFEVTFHGSVGRYPKDKEVDEAIVAQLSEVGIIANLEILENTVFSQMSREGTIGPMNIYGWQYMPAMDIDQPIPYFMCDQPRKNFCDPKLDQLITDMDSTIDETQRLAKAQELAVYLADVAPVLFLWQFHSIYGIQPYVTGFTPTSALAADLTQVTVQK
jgi:peptide/nickel transport system substrate-binding protein